MDKGINFLLQKGLDGKLTPKVKDALLGYLNQNVKQTPIDPSRPTAMFQETIDKYKGGQTPVQPMGRVFPEPLKYTPENIFSNLLPKKVEETVSKITPIEPFKKLEEKVPAYEPSEKYQTMVNSLFEPSRLIAEKIKPEGATGTDVLKNAGEFALKVGKTFFVRPIMEGGISLADIPYYLKTGKHLPSVNIPIYGNLESLQSQTKKAIDNGMNPMIAALYYGSVGILDVARVGMLIDSATQAILNNQTVPNISKASARQILQVPEQGFNVSDADYEDLVHRSYIKMSAFYHPDRYLDPTQKEWAEAAFKEIQKAYLVLQHPNISAAKDIARVLQADPRDILAGNQIDTRDFVSYFVDAHRTLLPERTGMMPEPAPATGGVIGALERQPIGLGVREVGDVAQTQASKTDLQPLAEEARKYGSVREKVLQRFAEEKIYVPSESKLIQERTIVQSELSKINKKLKTIFDKIYPDEDNENLLQLEVPTFKYENVQDLFERIKFNIEAQSHNFHIPQDKLNKQAKDILEKLGYSISEKTEELSALIDSYGGYITTETDIQELVDKFGNFSVVVKDVNGQKARMNINDYLKLRKIPKFFDRIRNVFINQYALPVDKIEMDEYFMEALQVEKLLEEPTQVQAKIGKLVDVKEITLSNESTITSQGAEKFSKTLTDNNVRQALKDNGIKEVVIQPPYRFGLSEQANINVKNKLISINADATNPTHTILHELGHNQFEQLSKDKQKLAIEYIKKSDIESIQGYLKNKNYEEAIADAWYNEKEVNNFVEKVLPRLIDINQVTQKPEVKPITEKIPTEPRPEPTFKISEQAKDIKKLAEATKQTGQYLKNTFSPASGLTSQQKDILFKNIGEMRQAREMFESQGKDIRWYFADKGDAYAMDFNYKYEHGNLKDMTPLEKNLAERYQELGDELYNRIIKWKDIPYIENWLGHIYEMVYDGKVVVPSSFSKKPLEGAKSFLKQRFYSDLKSAEEAGKVVAVKNPEEIFRRKYAEVMRFDMANNMKEAFIESGDFKFVKTGQQAPDNFKRINDKIARVYFPATTISGGKVISKAGEWWAQEDLARVVNNYLSDDWFKKNVLGRSLQQVNNSINMVNLALSAFHFVATSFNAMGQQIGQAYQDLVRLKPVSAAAKLITSPLAGPTNFVKGRILINKMLAGDPEALKLADQIYEGGGSLGMPKDMVGYINSMKTELGNKNYAGALARAIPAMMEATMKPLMQYYVPAIKVSSSLNLYQRGLEKYADRIEAGTMTIGDLRRSSWNAVDYLFGKMSLDNIFWNNTLKSSLQTMWRSVTWNLGTLKRLGGGEIDMMKQIAGGFKGQKPEFTDAMADLLGVITAAVIIGGTYHYLHTGERPKELKDYLFPKTGQKDDNGVDIRVSIPGYGKDLYYWHTAPIQTAKKKTSPLFNIIIASWENENFFGDMIRNQDETVSIQLKQQLKFLADAMKPFSVQQVQRSIERDEPTYRKIEGFFGFVEAPRAIRESPIVEEIYKEYRAQTGGDFKKTPEAAELMGEKAKARRELKKGKVDTFIELIKSGDIKDPKRFIKDAYLTSSQRAFRQLSKERKIKLFMMMDKKERPQYIQFLVPKS